MSTSVHHMLVAYYVLSVTTLGKQTLNGRANCLKTVSNEVAELFSRDQMALRLNWKNQVKVLSPSHPLPSNKCRVVPKFVNRSFDRFSFGPASNRFQTVTSRRIIYKQGRNWVVRNRHKTI